MSTRKRGEGTIRKHGNLFQWQLHEDGKCLYASAKTMEELKDKIAEQGLLAKMGVDRYATKKQNLEQMMYLWLRNVKRKELKPSSYDAIEFTIKNYIVPYIGHLPCEKITTQMIQTTILDAMQEKGLSFSSTKKAKNALNGFFKYCLQNQILSFNPISGTVLRQENFMSVKRVGNMLIEEEETDVKSLTLEQIEVFKEKALSTFSQGQYCYRNGPMAIFILNTGLRMGEASALTWADIDLDKREVSVNGNIVVIEQRDKNGIIIEGKPRIMRKQTTTKSKSGKRTIPLTNLAYEMLMILKGEKYYFGPSSPVFSTKTGSYQNPRFMTNSIKKMYVAADIQGLCAHSLRHTFASQLFEKGVDIKDISYLLGHSSVEITYKIYIHLAEARSRRVIDTLGDI